MKIRHCFYTALDTRRIMSADRHNTFVIDSELTIQNALPGSAVGPARQILMRSTSSKVMASEVRS